MRVDFDEIKEKIDSLPVKIVMIAFIVTFVLLMIITSLSSNTKKEPKPTVNLEETYLKDANANYHNISKQNAAVAGDKGNVTSPSIPNVNISEEPAENLVDSSSSSNDSTPSNTAKSSNEPSNNSEPVNNEANNNEANINEANNIEENNLVPSENEIPSFTDGSSAKVASSSDAGNYAMSAGFSQLMANNNAPVSNIYYYEEGGIYCGQIVSYSNYTIIYLISRTPSFDLAVKNVLNSLVASYSDTVWNKFNSSYVSQSFYIGEDKRLVRIVVPLVGGHYQIVIYN